MRLDRPAPKSNHRSRRRSYRRRPERVRAGFHQRDLDGAAVFGPEFLALVVRALGDRWKRVLRERADVRGAQGRVRPCRACRACGKEGSRHFCHAAKIDQCVVVGFGDSACGREARCNPERRQREPVKVRGADGVRCFASDEEDRDRELIARMCRCDVAQVITQVDRRSAHDPRPSSRNEIGNAQRSSRRPSRPQQRNRRGMQRDADLRIALRPCRTGNESAHRRCGECDPAQRLRFIDSRRAPLGHVEQEKCSGRVLRRAGGSVFDSDREQERGIREIAARSDRPQKRASLGRGSGRGKHTGELVPLAKRGRVGFQEQRQLGKSVRIAGREQGQRETFARFVVARIQCGNAPVERDRLRGFDRSN